jgi:tetratricopeptide (TPR) repeat protein
MNKDQYIIIRRSILLGISLIIGGFIFAQDNIHIDSLFSEYKNSNDPEQKITTLSEISSFYLKKDIDKAENYSEELLAFSTTHKNNNGIHLAYMRLAIVEKSKGNYTKSIYFLKKSIQIAMLLEEQIPLARSYNNLGLLYLEIGEYLKSLDYHHQSKIIKDKLKDSLGIASSLNNIGLVHQNMENYDKSLTYFFKSLEIKKKLGLKNKLSSTYNNIGTIYHILNDFNSALRNYNKSLELDSAQGNILSTPNTLTNIGLVYKDKKEYDKALYYYNRALVISSANNLNNNSATTNLLLGSLYFENGELKKAIVKYKKARDIFTQINSPKHLADVYYNVGKTYLKVRDNTEALFNINKSIEFSRPIKYYSKLADNYKALSEVYSTLGNYQKSLESYRYSSFYKDSVFNQDADKRLKRLIVEFETKEKEKEIEILSQDKKLKEIELSIKNYFILGLIVASVILFGLIIMTLQRYRYTKKIAKEMRSQQAKVHKQETDNLELKIEIKHKELASNIIRLVEKNELIEKTSNTLLDFKENLSQSKQKEINDILLNLKSNTNVGIWKEFKARFSEVHIDFHDKLSDQFPDLTPNERKLCTFLKLNMSSKDIASITMQSLHSINVARTRLRKKLGISNLDINTIAFISRI